MLSIIRILRAMCWAGLTSSGAGGGSGAIRKGSDRISRNTELKKAMLMMTAHFWKTVEWRRNGGKGNCDDSFYTPPLLRPPTR